jgi:hypothetical protein
LISANSLISYQETQELEQTDRQWLNWQGNGAGSSRVQVGIYHNMRKLMNVMNVMSLEQMTKGLWQHNCSFSESRICKTFMEP